MAIYTNDISTINYGGSQISPADTYVQPVVQQDKGLEQLGDALSNLGGKFTQLSSAQTQVQQNQPQPTDLAVQEVVSGIKNGDPQKAQSGAIYSQQSAPTKYKIDDAAGYEIAKGDTTATLQELRSNPQYINNASLREQKIAEINANAWTVAKEKFPGSDPMALARQNGYVRGIKELSSGVRNDTNQLEDATLKKEQIRLLGSETTDAAGKAFSTGYQTAKDVGVDTSYLKSIVKGGAAENPDDSIDHLTPGLAGGLTSALQAMPENLRSQVTVVSAHRDDMKQESIMVSHFTPAQKAKWEDYKQQAGGDLHKASELARDWYNSTGLNKRIGMPGFSQHGKGDATDLGDVNGNIENFGKTEAGKWLHANGAQFGLTFPLGNEPWHIESASSSRKGSGNDGDGPSTPVGGTTGDPISDAVARIKQVESGGRYDAQNPNSSAGGVGQFLDSTWLTYAKKAGATGTNAQILAMKKDTSDAGKAFQDKVLDTFTRANAERLQANGIAVNASSLYAMHHMGEGNAIKILKSSDGTPMTDFVTGGTLTINGLPRSATVGQYKEWLARKMGGPVSQTVAAQNAVRSVNQTWQRVGSVGDLIRRDAISSNLLDMATKTGDQRYLNALPPELMTPQIQADFNKARTQIAAAQFTQQRQALALQKEQREQETYDGKVAINQKMIAGEKIDLSDPAIRKNPELFQYAITNMGKTLNPVAASQANSNVRASLEDAAVTGNWSRINPEWTEQPSRMQLNNWIASNETLSPEDKMKLIETDANKIIDQGQLSVSKEYTDYFDDNFKTSFEQMDKAMENKDGAAGAYGVSFAETGKKAFNKAVQDGVKAYAEDNSGNLPRGKARQDILDRADRKAREAVDLLQKAIQSDSTREGVRAAQETIESKYVRSGGNQPVNDDRPASQAASNQMTEDQAAKAGYTDTGKTITTPDGKTYKQMADANGNVIPVATTNAINAPASNPTATPETSHNYTQAPDPAAATREMTPNEMYGGGTGQTTAKKMYGGSDQTINRTANEIYGGGNQNDNRSAAEIYGGTNAPKGTSGFDITKEGVSNAVNGLINFLSTATQPGNPDNDGHRDTSVIEDFISFINKHQSKLKPYIQTGPNAKRMDEQDQGTDVLDLLPNPDLNKARDYLEANKPKVDPQAILKSKKKKN